MTVKELIAKFTTFPNDHEVLMESESGITGIYDVEIDKDYSSDPPTEFVLISARLHTGPLIDALLRE